MKTFVIIDAHALIHRAFHALPPMTTSAGVPTGAVYGFFSIMLKILKDLKPDYVAAAFDLPKKTFRHEEFAEYKEHRPKAPNELVSQIIAVRELVPSFHVAMYEKPRYEADDIIGTIVEKLYGFDGRIIIVTGDMDTLQLVRDNVRVLTLKRGMSDTVMYGEKEIWERWGLSASQMIDYKALKGDPSDNIPGVPGIGEKSAASLLAEYRTLEGVYKAAEDKKSAIKDSIRKKLLENKEQAFFSRQLSAIVTDVDIDFRLDDCAFRPERIADAKEAIKKYEFFSLIRRIDDVLGGDNAHALSEAPPAQKSAQTASDPERVIEAIGREKKSILALDGKERLMLFSSKEKTELSAHDAAHSAAFRDMLRNGDTERMCFDAKNLYKFFNEHALPLGVFRFDAMLACYLLRPDRKDYSPDILLRDAALPVVRNVSCAALFSFFDALKTDIARNGMDTVLYDIEMPLALILASMEEAGIGLDKAHLASLKKQLIARVGELEKEIFAVSGVPFNISSPKQVAEILFEKMHITATGIKKTATGQISTRASELDKLAKEHQIVRLIAEHRELMKLKTTYVDVLPEMVREDGRIHTTYNQCGTATGRLSSQDPNLQNIPARSFWGNKIRKAFTAKKGYLFLSFDYSQVELRIIASLSRDEKMIAAFREGQDIHRITAAEVHGVAQGEVDDAMRFAAKALNFGVIYGMGPKGFAESSGMDRKHAKQFIETYFERFSGVRAYLESLKTFARQKGYAVTMFGRRRYLPDLKLSHWQRKQAAERMAINMPIQGTAADLMKLAMIGAEKELDAFFTERRISLTREAAALLLQIHDELIFEVREEYADDLVPRIQRAMERVATLEVPLVVREKRGRDLGTLA